MQQVIPFGVSQLVRGVGGADESKNLGRGRGRVTRRTGKKLSHFMHPNAVVCSKRRPFHGVARVAT